MSQFGLIQHWENQFLPQPGECFTNYQDIPKQPRISLKNLSGAFLILLVGLTTAFIAFIIEQIVYYHKQNFGSILNKGPKIRGRMKGLKGCPKVVNVLPKALQLLKNLKKN